MATPSESATSLEGNRFDLPAFARRDGVDLGVLYCLSNPGMPNLYKIGYSLNSAEARATQLYEGYRDLYVTGVPCPFEVVREWEFLAADAKRVEQAVHRLLHLHRENADREFFRFESTESAVMSIETALADSDWFATSAAAAADKVRAVADRAARLQERKDALEAKKRADKDDWEQRQALVAMASNQLYEEARTRIEKDGRLRGLAMAAAWGGGTAWVMYAMTRSPGVVTLALCGLVAWLAYVITKDGPYDAYVNGPEFKAQIARIVIEASEPQKPSATSELRTPLKLPTPPSAPTAARSSAMSGPASALAPVPPRPGHSSSAPPGFRCPTCWAIYTGPAVEPEETIRCSGCRSTFTYETRAPIGTHN